MTGLLITNPHITLQLSQWAVEQGRDVEAVLLDMLLHYRTHLPPHELVEEDPLMQMVYAAERFAIEGQQDDDTSSHFDEVLRQAYRQKYAVDEQPSLTPDE